MKTNLFKINKQIREMRKENFKYINASMQSINSLLGISSAIINIPTIGYKDGIGFLSKKNNVFILDIETKQSFRHDFKKQLYIEISRDDNVYTANSGLFIGETPQFEKVNLKYTIELHKITSGICSSDMYYRIVLQTEDNILLPFQMPVQVFNWENACCTGMMKTTINNVGFDIFEITFQKTKYMIIDCNEKSNVENFYDYVLSILVSIGFLTSRFIQDDCCILASNDIEYKFIDYIEYRSLRKSIKMPFRFLDNNSFNYFDLVEAKKHLDDMPAILQNHFDNMVNLCYSNVEILNSLFMFIVSSNYPLDTKPACVSVAMEGMCGYIMEQNKNRVNPIKDKSLAKRFKHELFLLLSKYENEISTNSPEGLTILKRKIENINSPTNQEKLIKPFELMQLELKEYEKTAIKNRNNFLHSNLEYELGRDIKERDSIAHQLFFTCCVLDRLFYELVLKLIKYDGKMVNNIKAFEHIFGEMPDENILIQL
jgi:hypothetical protein